MPGGKGILVPNPLATPADMAKRLPESVDVKQRLSHVLEAVGRINERIAARRGSPPLPCAPAALPLPPRSPPLL